MFIQLFLHLIKRVGVASISLISMGAILVESIGVIAGGIIGISSGLALSSVAPFTVSLATTLLPMAGVIGIGLIAAAFAVRRVTRVDPLLALGGN